MKMANANEFFFSKINDFLEIYIPKQQNGSSNTKATYKYGMKIFRTYVNGIKVIATYKFKFSDCSYDFLLDFRNYLHDEKHLAEKTANNRLAAIKSYVNYAAARDVSLQQFAFAVSQVPFYPVPIVMQPIIEDTDALAAILSMPPNTKKGLRDKVIMAVFYDVGLRLEELLSLRIRDFDLSNDAIQIKIHGKRKKERFDVMDEKTSALVRQYLDEYHPHMDPCAPFIYTTIKGQTGPMSRRNVESLIKKYADKARANYLLPKTVSPHTLRRTRGTMLYRDGTEIEAIATKFGHASVKTTRDHYTSRSHEQMKELAQKKNEVIPDAEPLWPDNEEDMDALLGF